MSRRPRQPPDENSFRARFTERVRARRLRYRQHGVIYRSAFQLAGFTVTLAGFLMIVLPGPALIVIPIGLAMLALEFAWAERLLDAALERAEAARRVASETNQSRLILGGIAIALALATVVAVALLYDVPQLPV